MPQRFKLGPERFCEACGSLMVRKKYANSMEDMTHFLNRRYCGMSCMGKGYYKADPTRQAYGLRARKLFLKANCELCGTAEKLSIHHKDRNWRNNNPENIQTLCNSCHTSLHHASGEIVPRATEQPCKFCGRPTLHRSVCNTCRTRIRRHGNPYHGWNEYVTSLRQGSQPER